MWQPNILYWIKMCEWTIFITITLINVMVFTNTDKNVPPTGSCFICQKALNYDGPYGHFQDVSYTVSA